MAKVQTTVKRTYSRVQEGPWTLVCATSKYSSPSEPKSKRPKVTTGPFPAPYAGPWIRTNQLPFTPEECARAAATTDRPWEVHPPPLSTVPLGQLANIQDGEFPRCISAPPVGKIRPTPVRRVSEPQSVPTVARPPPGDAAPILGPGSPADSTSSSGSPSPRGARSIANKRLLAQFALRDVQSGHFGEWNSEKKDVLCAYFLGNSSPSMGQRIALGHQVKLETLQVSKFFSRTRSEIKYCRTTLDDIRAQATLGMQFAGAESPRVESSAPLLLAEDNRKGCGRVSISHGTRLEVGQDVTASPVPSLNLTRNFMRSYKTEMRDAHLAQAQGLVAPSVQEAARNLVSISCAYRSASSFGGDTTSTDRVPSTRATSTSGGSSPGLRLDLSSLCGPPSRPITGSSSVPGISRDDMPYFPSHRRVVSLFGPDTRKLPIPVPSYSCGRSGSLRLDFHMSANQSTKSPSSMRDTASSVDALSLAADVFLSATPYAR